jgi:hypothetical protein
MTNENLFTSSKQSLVIKPKTVAIQAFNYHGIADLENLIGFVGTTPKVNVEKGTLVLSFGKKAIKDNSIILRNPFGEVDRVMTYAEANEMYEIAGQSDFKAEHKNKVQEKPKRTRTSLSVVSKK